MHARTHTHTVVRMTHTVVRMHTACVCANRLFMLPTEQGFSFHGATKISLSDCCRDTNRQHTHASEIPIHGKYFHAKTTLPTRSKPSLRAALGRYMGMSKGSYRANCTVFSKITKMTIRSHHFHSMQAMQKRRSGFFRLMQYKLRWLYIFASGHVNSCSSRIFRLRDAEYADAELRTVPLLFLLSNEPLLFEKARLPCRFIPIDPKDASCASWPGLCVAVKCSWSLSGLCKAPLLVSPPSGLCKVPLLVSPPSGLCKVPLLVSPPSGLCKGPLLVSPPSGLCKGPLLVSPPSGLCKGPLLVSPPSSWEWDPCMSRNAREGLALADPSFSSVVREWEKALMSFSLFSPLHGFCQQVCRVSTDGR
jgi:hypothetical protein